MFEPFRVLVKPLVHAWAAIKDRRVSVVPRPTDLPQVHAGGPASDTILIVGSGPAVGWGVLSHELALPGALARSLSARTGRGAHVDAVGSPTMNVSNAPAAIAPLKLWRYDGIVVTVGINDSIRLVSPARWEKSLRALLSLIHAGASRDARVFIVGVQPIRSIQLYDDAIGSIAAAHARTLNEISRRVCDEDARATFIPLPAAPVEPARYRSKDAYQVWGNALADGMAMVMDGAFEEADGDREVAIRAEAERQRAVDELGIVDTAPEAKYDRIVSMARQLFGTESAAFSVTDHDRQWYKSRIGIDVEEIARSESFCAPTVERRGPLIVADALDDPQFSKNPFVLGDPHVRFYAGFPIHSRSGEPIGVLCVFDPQPRRAADVDIALLHRLALQVQRELQAGST
ncbi:MAG: GAF domain-containing protein [Pseudolysinimonas sp.]